MILYNKRFYFSVELRVSESGTKYQCRICCNYNWDRSPWHLVHQQQDTRKQLGIVNLSQCFVSLHSRQQHNYFQFVSSEFSSCSRQQFS
jgi:hypothetical protein